MKVAWTRAIRFVAPDGRVLRGEPILPSPNFDIGKSALDGSLKAKVIVGDDLFDTTGATYVSDEVVTVSKLLGPLAQEDVPILRCVGLNYTKHSKLSRTLDHVLYSQLRSSHLVKEVPGRTPPPFPSIFFKPNTTVNDHDAVVTVPKLCQDDQADYEGELVCCLLT